MASLTNSPQAFVPGMGIFTCLEAAIPLLLDGLLLLGCLASMELNSISFSTVGLPF